MNLLSDLIRIQELLGQLRDAGLTISDLETEPGEYFDEIVACWHLLEEHINELS